MAERFNEFVSMENKVKNGLDVLRFVSFFSLNRIEWDICNAPVLSTDFITLNSSLRMVHLQYFEHL